MKIYYFLSFFIFIFYCKADVITPLDRLSKSIQFKTVSATEKSKETEAEFQKYHLFLKNNYPLVYKNLELKQIGNTLCFKWSGANVNSKPYLFLAHQDVVPVDDVDEVKWKKPSFSGQISDGYLWGRGTLDDKAALHSILESVEVLLKNNFKPASTIFLAFGHDEEIGGKNGQKLLAEWFKSQGIQFESVFDEGMAFIEDLFPEIKNGVALVGIAEKGYLSIKITVEAKGGHSSMPASNNAIITLSDALLKIKNNPFPKTMHSIAQEFLARIGNHIPGIRGFLLRHPKMFSKILIHEMQKDPASSALLSTTTAFTMVKGGIKDNIIPNSVEAVINFRILTGMTSDEILNHIKNTVNNSSIKIEKITESETPAVLSSSINNKTYETLENTIQMVFPSAVVAPSIVLASTDSKHYRDLTNQIYRFVPIRLNKHDLSRIHGIDERILVNNYLEMIEFYKTFIQALK